MCVWSHASQRLFCRLFFYASCDQQEKGDIVLAAIYFCLLFFLLLLSELRYQKPYESFATAKTMIDQLATVRGSCATVPPSVPWRMFQP